MDVIAITPPGYAPASRQAMLLLPGAVDRLARREASLQAAAAERDREGSPAARVAWEQAKRSRDDAAARVAKLRQAAGLDQIGGA